MTMAAAAFWVVGAMAQTTVDLKVTLDLTYQMIGQVSSTESFDPATDVVNICGTMNSWTYSEPYKLTQVEGADSLYEVTLTGLTPGTVLEFKFRFDTGSSWIEGKSEFWGGSNRKYTVRSTNQSIKCIYDNYYRGWVPVTVNVNMKKMVADGKFTSSSEVVDVAGTFNNWGNGGYDQLWDADADGIYSNTILAPVGEMKWKARIDLLNEDSTLWEFHGISNSDRSYTVLDIVESTTNEISIWFNDEELGVKQDAFKQVSVYPNPATNEFTVNDVANATQIELVNMLGKTVKTIMVNSRNSVDIPISELSSGIYFAVIKDAANNARAIKVVKQ